MPGHCPALAPQPRCPRPGERWEGPFSAPVLGGQGSLEDDAAPVGGCPRSEPCAQAGPGIT